MYIAHGYLLDDNNSYTKNVKRKVHNIQPRVCYTWLYRPDS